MAIHDTAFKEKIRELRRNGMALTQIAAKYKIAKSTLHYWFRDLPSRYSQDEVFRHDHLNRARLLAHKALRAKKTLRIEQIHAKVKGELEQFPDDNISVQKAILTFLYWAEGEKTSHFKFANSDPSLALLFLTLLRNTFPIEEKNIRITLYLHWYHKVGIIRTFWSKLLKIPKEQFTKVYIKPRGKNSSRKRKNFAGVCFIKYGTGAENLRQEVMIFAKAIQEKISPMRP